MRTRQDFVCTERCLRQMRRMVWDGDQLLYEVAAPGATSATAAQMERDTGLITPFGTGGYFFQTGRVEYVHGHGIDAPLAFYREEYSDSIPGASFIPQANWRGVYDMGVRSGACYFRNWTTQPATPPDERKIGGVDTTSNSGGTSGTETLCADVEWPAQYTWAYHQYRRGYSGPYSWMGSLAFGSRDASGLHYRRNRFYDAESGRFTQEDPIGMAGGINVYGFANGDPVSYSDPYGLSAEESCCLGLAYDGINPRRIQENAEWNEQLTTRDRVALGIGGLAAAAGPWAIARVASSGSRIAAGSRAARTMAETRGILRSSGMQTLRNAATRNVQAEVQIGGRTVVYVPGMRDSGMTLFGENGFALGRNAFSSSMELTKTVLHELYRLNTSARGAASAGGVARETAAAWRFADRAYSAGRSIGLW